MVGSVKTVSHFSIFMSKYVNETYIDYEISTSLSAATSTANETMESIVLLGRCLICYINFSLFNN